MRARVSVSSPVWRAGGALALFLVLLAPLSARHAPVENVELQPLAAHVGRLIQTLDYLGAPLVAEDRRALEGALRDSDSARAIAAFQRVLDKYCLLDVHINPESRVKVTQGPAKAQLVENGWRTFLVKVRNDAGVTTRLAVESPNALPVWARGAADFAAEGFTLDAVPKKKITEREILDRWLDLSSYDKPPFTPVLSGLELEYRIVQLYSRDSGKREATFTFNVGQGTQDIGFRSEAAILFTVQPSIPVTLRVLDEQGRPTTASLIVRDALEHIYPSRAKRLAPDFAFHPQIYRRDGEQIWLPAGEYSVEFTRGPEYLIKRHTLQVERPETLTLALERWIDLARLGWYSGDHHIHSAGCLHYEAPTIGVKPDDMIRHIVGEDLNVGSVLTWGPGYYFQKQFFEGKDHSLSTAEHRMHYDLEVSGFPSSHSGHLVLLGLRDQDYPGTKMIEDWPSWNLPIMKWAKAQGALVGFAHSGLGLDVNSDQLPNYEMPAFDHPVFGGIGANEYIVDVTHDAVDFISTMDTRPVSELNIWYHTLNAGFRTRISGETDFPCIYGDRVGVGRSYVHLDRQLGYEAWVDGVRSGRSYTSDGLSHLIDFQVNNLPVGSKGSELRLAAPTSARVTARVAAMLDEHPDTRRDERRPWSVERARIANSREVPVEVIVNGVAVARKQIVADGAMRDVAFDVPIQQSSWVALRILPSSHTNPIFVLVGDKPIRASVRSAEWCLKAVDVCWKAKLPKISAKEQPDAERAYEHARQVYRRILAEAGGDSLTLQP
jgi:hypothetical protein